MTGPLRIATRGYDELRQGLQDWLRALLPADAEPIVGPVAAPGGNGMSSDTVMFELTTATHGARRCVARIAPQPDAVPVFPHYDLARQFQIMCLVAERSDVPVPEPLWCDTDGVAAGSPLFVMAHIDGDIPPDVMPYNFGGWLAEADQADRARLQHSTIVAIAGIHDIELTDDDVALLDADRDELTPLRRHVAEQRDYYRWVSRERRHPLIERGFDWLTEHWPAEEGPAVLSWGDARIGNIIYRDFQPVGVLDWEMAALGPRELDIGWLIYHHRFFEDLAAMAGLDGLPGFLRPEAVTAAYQAVTGYQVRDLRFYVTYAALRNAIVMARMAQRQVRLGEREQPADPDDVLYDRSSIEALLDGTYWDALG
ncbi:phosphotransferase family protein [Haloechinothrix halophila]|uniref:phosphotransferase family protein n=1 Tax=Haloechinothrix halophila TaxID=1069073 RepID=UPI00041D78C8|nr:phosphotransferase family protein [Haloechinothrix halophila]